MSALVLTLPLEASLAAANAALQAAPPGEVEWVLPVGEGVLTTAVVIGSPVHALRLRGGVGVTLKLDGGSLEVIGLVTALVDVTVVAEESAGLLLKGVRVEVSDVSVGATASGDCTALTVETPDGTVSIDSLTVTGAKGTAATGLLLAAKEARVTGLSVASVEASSGAAFGVRAVCQRSQWADVKVRDVVGAGAGVGLELAGLSRANLSGVTVSKVTGARALGVRVLVSREEGEGLSAVDVAVSDVKALAAEWSVGLVVGSPGAVQVRGFTVRQVQGALALGMLALGGRGIEVGIGQVEEVLGGTASAGLRVLGGPSLEPVTVRDVEVSRVSGAPVPVGAQPAPAWSEWLAAALEALTGSVVGPLTLPVFPSDGDVVGLHVAAPLGGLEPVLDAGTPGEMTVEDCSLFVITGTALQLEGGLRTALVRRTEAWTSVHAGWLQAEQLLLAQLTWHRHAHGLRLGPGEVRAYDSLFTAIVGAPFVLETDAELSASPALFAEGAAPPFLEVGPLPYVTPGTPQGPPVLLTGVLPPPETVDLRLVPDAAVARAGVLVPGDGPRDPAPFVGAWAPDVVPGCDVRDPQPRPWLAAPERPAPGALVDYLARDARSLLAVMLERARTVMAPWQDRGPADFTTMLLEAVAAQLDSLAYQQERAVVEGFLEQARLRRSVEDHARGLDYAPDPGLSATTMLRFRLDAEALAALVKARLDELDLPALPPGTTALEFLTGGGVLEFPADTLVANASTQEHSLVFVTESPLSYFPRLDAVTLAESVLPGDTGATLAGVYPELEVGRWLVLYRGRGEGGHVVRVTSVALATDTTFIGWDPRRLAPEAFLAPGDPTPGPRATVLGNVVPAHHGLPVTPLPEGFEADSAEPFARSLAQWRALLSPIVDGSQEREVVLPFHPISVQAPGYPLPGDALRRGTPQVQVSVEDDPWSVVEDLSVQGPGDEVVVLRATPTGGASLRCGDGVNGAALPPRETALGLSLRIGLGTLGNVGEGVLTRLLQVPLDPQRSASAGELLAQPMDDVRLLVRVDNPLPAVGGRDAESLDSIRYRAPAGVSQPLSAVTVEDYVRLLQQLPEVAGASARVVHRDLRTVIRVTVLLRDEDTLDRDELLRRWAGVRRRLEEIRLLGVDVEALPPRWVPLDLDLEVDAAPHAQADLVRDAVVGAIAGDGGLLDPDRSGLNGDVQLADLYQAVLRVSGVTAVRVKRFRRLESHLVDRLAEGVIPIGPEEVATARGGYWPGSEGVLTVHVCGGLR
ncbi:baseplate J/gp47 family protein [Corallococcus llansteffanensis]|uniref:Uncharacterized protein n=1 Tax=Corallococcus llansteffanensis TaxID=2316731 RepID=A0A3A8PHX6_9BACT|nr:baseplate J/gp47 family protein [Corallococcus llansteffanensis]RKH55923.1 hypothetical protein D7V93_21555 [Corallococcus llansteffanensis]